MPNKTRIPSGNEDRATGSKKLVSKRSSLLRRSQRDLMPPSNIATSAQDRIRGHSAVMAEIKTNVIIGDEFTFMTELSYHLSMRYQRPVSSIVVTLQHGACMLFGGTFEPAYVMSVTAIPAQLQPASNRVNAALIQTYVEEALGVLPARGLLRFVPQGEGHLARGGNTIAGQIEELARGERAAASVSAKQQRGEDGGGRGPPAAAQGTTQRARKRLNAKVRRQATLLPGRLDTLSSHLSITRSPARCQSFRTIKTTSSHNLTPPASSGEEDRLIEKKGSPRAGDQKAGTCLQKVRPSRSLMASLLGRASRDRMAARTVAL